MEDVEILISEIADVSNKSEYPEAFDIYVKDGIYGNKTTLYVTKHNWLVQVYEATAMYLGFHPKIKDKVMFVNESCQYTFDDNLSLEEFNVTEGGTITIHKRYFGGACCINTILYDAEMDSDVWTRMIEIHSSLESFFEKKYLTGDYFFICKESDMTTDDLSVRLCELFGGSHPTIGYKDKCELIAIKKDTFEHCYKKNGVFVSRCNKENINIFESPENWRKELQRVIKNM